MTEIDSAEIKGIASRVVELPRAFKRVGNVSIQSLLEQTGYFQVSDQISEQILRQALTNRPEFVRDWIAYSEDKRSTGWYITKNSEIDYEVGFVDEDVSFRNKSRYNNAIDAVAGYIKREIEGIKGFAIRKQKRG